jgi:hypothetical protein
MASLLPMTAVLLLAPVFLLFEIGQLVLSERYLGIKQIAHNADPRTLGLSEITAFVWSMALMSYWVWMVVLIGLPLGRVHGLCLLLIAIIGYTLRRGCELKWVLVILTFEGAMRVGLLVSLSAMAWKRI